MDALGSDAAREDRMLRQIVEGTNAGVAVLDTRLRYLYVNPSMARWTGIPAEDHIGRTLAELLPHVHRSEDVLRQVLHDGQPREQILSGSTLASSAFEDRSWHSTYHRWEEDGRVLGLIGVGLEISAPRHYLRTLETAHRRLTLVDAAGRGSAAPWTWTPPAPSSPTSWCPASPTWPPSRCWPRTRRVGPGRRRGY
ncbi:PAS domain-containing protein [Streptomyces sp. MS1.HAVA.3]|uniref:PAS domain-containing protein n=1 Tax=Streptomyces caledonius TaxID=3134107 RepID=A0ABU8TYQ8_9ACTN